MIALWRLKPLLRIIFALLMIMAVTLPTKVNADLAQRSSNVIGQIEKISFDSDGNLITWDLTTDEKPGNPTTLNLAGVYSGIAADNAYAYIVDHMFYTGAPGVGLRIVDFLTPGGPYLKGFLNIDLANDVFVKSGYAYVVSGYGQFSHLFSVVDISDPSTPTLVGSAQLGGPGQDIFVDGSYAYVAIGGFGFGVLQVINISNPAVPHIVGTFYNGYGAYGLFEHEKIVYLGDEYGLIALDVSQPSSPQQLSFLRFGGDDPTSVGMLENYIYLTFKVSSHTGRLIIVDLTQPSNPVQISSTPFTEGIANDILLLGNYAFIANDTAGLRFMDISDSSNPITLDLLNTSGTAFDLAINNNNLYLANGNSVYYFTLNLYSIHGKVVDPSGHPHNNFPIKAGNYSHNITDEDGQYSLDGLFEGDYLPEAVKNGFHIIVPANPVHVPPTATISDIVVASNSITGQILAANRKPVGGIEILSSDGKVSYSGGSGRYLFSELLEQTYTIVPTDSTWVFQPLNFSFVVPPYTHKKTFWILPPPQTIQLEPGVPNQITYQDVQGTITSIQFPSDTVTTTTGLILTPGVLNSDWQYKFAGHAFNIMTMVGALETGISSINAPVPVTFEYSDDDLLAVTDEASLVIRYYGSDGWEDAADTCNPASPYSRDIPNKTISLSVCKTGLFGLYGPSHQVIVPVILHSP